VVAILSRPRSGKSLAGPGGSIDEAPLAATMRLAGVAASMLPPIARRLACIGAAATQALSSNAR